jgi:hypothetical protein
MQRLSCFQQQSIEKRTLHIDPRKNTSFNTPKRPTYRCALTHRRCFSHHSTTQHDSCCSLPKLWNYNHSIMAKRRERAYNLQRVWYVNSDQTILTHSKWHRFILQAPRRPPPRNNEEIGHQAPETRCAGRARNPSIRNRRRKQLHGITRIRSAISTRRSRKHESRRVCKSRIPYAKRATTARPPPRPIFLSASA